MRCKSVACVWPSSPPVQQVTATAVLQHPSTLYTGGSDGSIIWWKLISSPDKPEIKPVAMLCGHAASIADLGTCVPDEGSDSVSLINSSNVLSNPNPIYCDALISACTDGVLCIWSRASGHCRRRRKLPPWAGMPSMIRPLPGNRRYVCITCYSVNQEYQSVEGNDFPVHMELPNVNPSKCTIIIVDSYALTIVQTVFHGNVTLGPLKSMAILLPSEDMEKHLVMIIDSFGKVLSLPIVKDPDPKEHNAPGTPKDSSTSDVTDSVQDFGNELLVAFAKCRHVLAFVHRTYCTFRQAHIGTVLGKISFGDNQLSCEHELYVVGCLFLGDDSGITSNVFIEDFLAWNNRGRAVIYRVSYTSNIFMVEPLLSIPAVLHPSDMKLSFSFIPLNKYLLRVKSVCCHSTDNMFWVPHISIWLLPQGNDTYGDIYLEQKMLGEGNLYDDWPTNCSFSTTKGPNHDFCEERAILSDKATPFQNSALSAGDHDVNHRNGTYWGGQLVSSSTVISESCLAPYAIVYGFFNGKIEVVRFHMFFTSLDSLIESPCEEAESHGQKFQLSGHRGAVLCLASHKLFNKSGGCSINHVLLSGSTDCTVRIWDLDSGNPITVLHHHVAPVRQIILPPSQSEYPWSDCFLSLGEDSCVALVSLQTLRVERLFPGHVYMPEKVVWDCVKGYIACLCPLHSERSDVLDILYIWDVKTGACERVLRGTAAHSMFQHFSTSIDKSFSYGKESSLVGPLSERSKFSVSDSKSVGAGVRTSTVDAVEPSTSVLLNAVKGGGVGARTTLQASVNFQSNKRPIESFCPFPGVSTLCFDLTSLMSVCSKNDFFLDDNHNSKNIDLKGVRSSTRGIDVQLRRNSPLNEPGVVMPIPHHLTGNSDSDSAESSIVTTEQRVHLLEESLLQFSLSFLHLWNIDNELDILLMTEMKLQRPDSLVVASGLLGDRGSMTLTFPGSGPTLELWRSSSEYSAMRSLTMVSLAQHLISLSHSCSSASSSLAAFYTRKFAAKISDVRPPLLQLLVSFWQNEFEHVKMAARSLFHCSASRAFPFQLCCSKSNHHVNVHTYPYDEQEKKHENVNAVGVNDAEGESHGNLSQEDSEITSWLESYDVQDWISCVGGTTQDAMTSQILVAAALAVWYPSLVKEKLSIMVVHQLIKLVMAMNEKYSAAAAEILAEGMESTWKTCIGSEIPRLIGDIFFQVECVSSTSATASPKTSAVSLTIREALVDVLLPSLAMADIPGYLHVIEYQIWSTASDSPVHVIALMTLTRVIRGSPRNLAPYLDKVVTFILQTMDPANSTMRRSCMHSSMIALKEVVRVFPMITLNDTSTRLAVGDAIGEINTASIRVYDMQSMSKLKVLDASGPYGLPTLLGGTSGMAIATGISALTFSPDGEGLVAFSENGLMIRWWSLGSVWWEKLSRNLVPVQCTKLIFVPPWEGFSPNSTRSSIMASVLRDDEQVNSPGNNKSSSEMDRLKILIHNLDLSYRLEWVAERKVKLTQHSHELGTFQL